MDYLDLFCVVRLFSIDFWWLQIEDTLDMMERRWESLQASWFILLAWLWLSKDRLNLYRPEDLLGPPRKAEGRKGNNRGAYSLLNGSTMEWIRFTFPAVSWSTSSDRAGQMFLAKGGVPCRTARLGVLELNPSSTEKREIIDFRHRRPFMFFTWRLHLPALALAIQQKITQFLNINVQWV